MKIKLLFRQFAILLAFSYSGWLSHAQQKLTLAQDNREQVTMQARQQNENNSSGHSSGAVDISPFDAVKGKKEDPTKRDAFSKHYINEDGSYTALIGAGPIHYEKNGQFLDIDHTITRQSDNRFSYANTTNIFESYFGNTSHTGVKSKTAEGEVTEFQNTKMYWEVNGQAVNTIQGADVAVSVQGDKAYYNNLFGSISAEFVMLTGKRELNYIIPNRGALANAPQNAEFLVFSEDVVLPQGWTSTETERGILIKDRSGKEIYLYENPFSTDASQELALSRERNTVFETSVTENVLTVKTKVKTSWLLDSRRQFPVKVDPTVDVYPNSTTNWTRSVASDGYDYSDFQFGRDIGYFLRGFVKYNLTSISSDATINSVSGHFYIFQLLGDNHELNSFRFKNGADPTQNSGSTLYNSATTFYSPDQPTNQSTGWKNVSFYNNIYSNVQNAFGNYLSLCVDPGGSWHETSVYKIRNHIGGADGSQKPYLQIDYTEPITDRTLTISASGTGASHGDGNHVFNHGESVTVSSGTRNNYIVAGWIGTGSVPATGSTGSTTFTITENSSIEWQWKLINTPENLTFHNYGGDDQLAYNNSRLDKINDGFTFRLSHEEYEATAYEIEVSSNSDFSSGNMAQPFTGTYAADTETNFLFDTGNFTDGTTYYVRARAKGAADIWSDWTEETYSFTYEADKEVADWFQTTTPQFDSDELDGVISENGEVRVDVVPGGNVLINGSFEDDLSNWTKDSNWGDWYVAEHDDYWSSDGNYSLLMWNTQPGTYGYSTGDYVSMYQTVDFTGVSNLKLDANYQSSSQAVELRIYIAETSNPTGANGTLVHTWRPPTGNNQISINVDLSSYSFTGNKILKLVYYVYDGYYTTNFRYLNIDNVRAEKTAITSGSITSTPIPYASVQNAQGYKNFIWTQTLGALNTGGQLTFDIQGSSDGETFNTIFGYEGIQDPTANGVHSYDISGIDPAQYPHLRIVGHLNGENVRLHDWAITFDVEEPAPDYDFVYWDDTIQWSPNYPGDANNPSNETHTILVMEGTATFNTNIVAKDLTVDEGANLEVEKILKLHGDFENNGLVTFKSTSIEDTAQFDEFDGDITGDGEFTVERFIPARRAFRFLSSAVTGGTINSNWMEGGQNPSHGTNHDPKPGYGTQITGPDPLINGFDPTGTNNPSMFVLETDGSAQTWVTVPNTAVNMEAGTPYRLLVRGDRNTDLTQNAPPASNTILRSTGALAYGSIPVTSGIALEEGQYFFVGNPYQAAVSVEALLTDDNENINTNHYYLWDPQLAGLNGRGAYTTVDLLDGGVNHNGSDANGYLQPGQAILLQSNGGVSSLLFKEEHKSVDQPPLTSTFLVPPAVISMQLYYRDAYDNGETPTDGLGITFSEGGNNGVDRMDAPKMGNLDENLATFNSNSYFAIERRAYPENEEVIPLFINNYRKTEYVLSGRFSNPPEHTTAFLYDDYTGIYTALSDEAVVYRFHIDPDIPATTFSNRFSIHFEVEYLGVEDLKVSSLELYPNPIKDHSFNIAAKGFEGKSLEVRVVNMIGQLVHSETVTVSADGNATVVLSENMASGIYGVKIITEDRQSISKKLIKN